MARTNPPPGQSFAVSLDWLAQSLNASVKDMLRDRIRAHLQLEADKIVAEAAEDIARYVTGKITSFRQADPCAGGPEFMVNISLNGVPQRERGFKA